MLLKFISLINFNVDASARLNVIPSTLTFPLTWSSPPCNNIVPGLAKLAVESKVMVPLAEVSFPLLITRAPFKVRSEFPVSNCSPDASRVSASLIVNPIDVVRA